MLIVTNRFHPQIGGAELNIFLQAQELSKHFEVDVFTPLRDNNKKRETVEGVRITRGFNWLNLRKEFPDLKSKTFCPSVFFKALCGKYDVIHCFPAFNYNNIMALMAGKIRGVPVFMSLFDLDDYASLIESGLSIEQIFEQQKRMTGEGINLIGKFNAIFTISNRETETIKSINENTFLSTVPIVLDEYEAEIDAADFKQRYHIPADVPLILCLGRVAKIKGPDILVKALPLLLEKTKYFHVAIVGRTDYEPEYVHDMERFIEEHDLKNHVTLTGVLPRPDVIAALKSCDVHVLPVRFMNSGAVVIETWAAYKPVLHSNMIDPCYVEEGENGFTFDVNNPQDLCKKLVTILSDKQLRENMGKKGRQLVEQKFLYPHLIRQYMEAYQELGNVKSLTSNRDL